MSYNPEIHIIILNWNGASVIKECITSVLSIDYPNKKIWLVDNGSNDNSVKIIESYKNINLIKYDVNYGFAKGYNKAADEISQDKSTSSDVIHHFINHKNLENENNFTILYLQPTSPLRTFSHIKESLEIFYKNNCETLISISESK